MYITFMLLGIVDLIAGLILFFNQSMVVKLISIALLTKGIISVIKAVQH
jgi:uncharacterized membrane protein HdeD (DUF308 family)